MISGSDAVGIFCFVEAAFFLNFISILPSSLRFRYGNALFDFVAYFVELLFRTRFEGLTERLHCVFFTQNVVRLFDFIERCDVNTVWCVPVCLD